MGVIVSTGVGERAFRSGGDVNWEAEGAAAFLEKRAPDFSEWR